ncbi:MAG: glycosyltransferase family 39 protein, partial [Acidimicrobiales bacterium]
MTTAVAAPPRPENRPRSRGARRAGSGAASAAAWCAAARVLAAGVALRVWPRSALWLDEAQSVAIARLPLRDIPAALREDGAPPLYYVLLHGWMALVGAGDTALRTLSEVASIVTIPVLAEAARRWSGGRAAAWTAALLLAANPFAIRYAAETRMHAVVMLEVSLGLLAVHAALAAATRARLTAVAALAAALLYTHYWALYLLAGAAATLAVAAWRRRGGARRAALACLGTLGVGGALWLPWLPSFLFQARRTATPWAEPPSPADLVRIAGSLTGVDGPSPLAP